MEGEEGSRLVAWKGVGLVVGFGCCDFVGFLEGGVAFAGWGLAFVFAAFLGGEEL